MPYRYRFMLLAIFVLAMVACSLIPQATPPTETAISPSYTPVATTTNAASSTAVPTDTARPSNTPAASDTPAPLTATISAAIAQQTQMVGTAFAQMGPMAHLFGFLIFLFKPSRYAS